jgi:hypothetical protein
VPEWFSHTALPKSYGSIRGLLDFFYRQLELLKGSRHNVKKGRWI